MKTQPLQVPRLVNAATVFAELATALKSGTLQGIVEHNEATGLFDRLFSRLGTEPDLPGYSGIHEITDVLCTIEHHLRLARRISRGTAPLATVERAKPLRKASRAKA